MLFLTLNLFDDEWEYFLKVYHIKVTCEVDYDCSVWTRYEGFVIALFLALYRIISQLWDPIYAAELVKGNDIFLIAILNVQFGRALPVDEGDAAVL